jgi:hypothetical protein
MKLKIPIPKFSFRTITSIVFIFIVIAELLLTFNYLYQNLQPATPVITEEKIIKADLKGYSQIYTDLNSRSVYEPKEFNYQNSNPFKFGQ